MQCLPLQDLFFIPLKFQGTNRLKLKMITCLYTDYISQYVEKYDNKFCIISQPFKSFLFLAQIYLAFQINTNKNLRRRQNKSMQDKLISYSFVYFIFENPKAIVFFGRPVSRSNAIVTNGILYKVQE